MCVWPQFYSFWVRHQLYFLKHQLWNCYKTHMWWVQGGNFPLNQLGPKSKFQRLEKLQLQLIKSSCVLEPSPKNQTEVNIFWVIWSGSWRFHTQHICKWTKSRLNFLILNLWLIDFLNPNHFEQETLLVFSAITFLRINTIHHTIPKHHPIPSGSPSDPTGGLQTERFNFGNTLPAGAATPETRHRRSFENLTFFC